MAIINLSSVNMKLCRPALRFNRGNYSQLIVAPTKEACFLQMSAYSQIPSIATNKLMKKNNLKEEWKDNASELKLARRHKHYCMVWTNCWSQLFWEETFHVTEQLPYHTFKQHSSGLITHQTVLYALRIRTVLIESSSPLYIRIRTIYVFKCLPHIFLPKEL